eukprot:g44899.t1
MRFSLLDQPTMRGLVKCFSKVHVDNIYCSTPINRLCHFLKIYERRSVPRKTMLTIPNKSILYQIILEQIPSGPGDIRSHGAVQHGNRQF